MNKIYKVIWSKAKNCYVVVSELAKSHTKSPKSRVISKITIAGILACTFVYGTTFPLSVDAAKYEAGGGNATGTNAIAVGTNSDASGDYGLSVGINADSKTLNSIAIGHGATADTATDSSGQIAIGYGATTNSGMAIGSGAKTGDKTDNVSGAHSIAFGLNSYAGGTNAVVIGAYTEGGKNSVVIGAEAVSYANTDSVAIGRSAVTHSNNTVVIGDNAIAYELGSVVIGPSAETENASAMSYGKHSVVLGMDGFVNADDSMALGANATAYERNSVALGTGSVANVANVISIGHVSGDESLLSTYTSDLYRRIINMANGTSAHDGATVGQIQTTTAGNGVAITNSNNSNGSVNHAIAVKASTGITVNGNGVSITPGSVTSGNVNAITGGTAYTELRPANGTFVKQNQTTAQNLTALDNAGKNAIKGLSVNGRVITYTKGDNTTGTITTQDTTYSAGNGLSLSGTTFSVKPGTNVTVNNDGVNVIGSGTVTNGNTGLVSGGTMYSELRSGATGNYISPDNTVGSNLNALDSQVKTNATDISNLKNLSNITEDGKTVVRNLAKESVKVIPGSYTNIVEGTDGNAKTYAVNVIVNGQIVENNEGIVTGNTVYQALEQQKTALETDLSGKANIELDNISDEGHNVIKTDAKASINVVGGEYATVTKSNQSGVDTYMVNVATNGEIEENNGNLVTGDTVYRALQDQQTAIDSGLAGKANVDASNITDTIAWGEKVGIGTVTEDNGQLVTGGTVYEALQSQKDMVDTALDGKANTDLDNVTDAGHDVIKADAKSVVNVVGGSYATVDKTDVDGVDTYTVNVDTNGEVSEGNDKLVTGGTVYQALANQQTDVNTALEGKANVDASNVTDATAWAEKIGTGVVAPENTQLVTGKKVAEETRVAEDGAYVSKDNTAGQNISALDVQVKANTDAITTLGSDKANKDLDNITDAGKDVVRELAKGSVKVVDGTYTTVTEGTDGDMKTYAVNVTADGIVAQNNIGIVTGGAVYNAIETAKESVSNDVDTKLEEYAKIDGSNVTTPTTWGAKLGTGEVLEGNGELVTGDTVYQTVKTLAEVTADALDVKANSDASNVGKNADTDNSTAWGEALGTGTISSNDTRLVTGETVYNEVRPATDGEYVKTTNTTAENLQVLDTQVAELTSQAQDAVSYDSSDHSKVTLSGGTNGTVVTNVADGELSETSTDAVTGKQLYATNSEISAIKDTLTDNDERIRELRADVNTLQTDVTELRTEYDVTKEQVATGFDVQTDGTKVKTVNPDSNVINFASGNHVVLSNDNGSVKIDVLDSGQIAEGNTGLVTGDTVYQAIEDMNIPGALDTKANTDLDNISDAGKDIVRNLAKGSVNVVGKDEIKVAKTTENDVDTYTVSIEPNGQVAEGNTGLVTGDTVYNSFQEIKNVYANKDASNVDVQVWGEKLGAGTVDSFDNKLVSGKTVAEETRVATDGNYVQQTNTAGQNLSELDRVLKETRDIAEAAALTGTDDNAVHYDGADKETITLAGDNGTIITNLKDGELSANSKDAVTGKQLFETNEKVAENTEKITALTDKVGTVSDGNYVNGNQTIGESIGALDTQLKTVSDGLDTVRNDVDTLRDTMTEGLDGKSNTDLSNITEEGKTVISNIAKDSVKVKGSGLATVTSAEEGQAMVYTVDVQANGVVEEGNTGLVDGGTVYNSIQEVRNDFATDLGDKADTDLGNLTDAGKEVIRDAMKGDLDKKADKVDLDTKANVDASNIDTQAWQEKLGDGVIEEGNTGLINGGTAYRAIQEIKENEVVKADFANGVIRLANDAKYDGIDVINVSKSDGSSRVMTGVATNPNDPTSVANVGYVNAIGQVVLDNVNNRFEQVDNKMSKVGASAAAMASLPMPPMDGDEKWAFSAAVGHYDSKTAGAVGAFYKPQDNVIVNVRGAVGNGEDMVGAGVGIALQRGNTPSVSKAQLVKTINAQAGKIQEQDARIAELEAVVAELVAKK